MAFHLGIIHLNIILIITKYSSGSGIIITEACQMEIFNAKCSNDRIIIMQTAFYGLMQIGTCIPSRVDGQGCFNDVLEYFDISCSGKRHCSISSMGESLQTLNTNCPRHIAPYIESSYICIPGKITGP